MARIDTDKELYGTGLFDESLAELKAGRLAEDFMIPPLTVLSAREGFWQDRKRAWLALGIKSELGRGGDMTWGTGNDLDGYRNDVGMSKTELRNELDKASPRGTMPAMNYKNRERGSGTGKAIEGTAVNTVSNPPTDAAGTLLIDRYRGRVAQNSTLAHPEIVRRPPIPVTKAATAPLASEPPPPAPPPVIRTAPAIAARTPPSLVAPAAKGRLGAPTIIVGKVAAKEAAAPPVAVDPLPESSLFIEARKYGAERIPFDEETWDEQKPGTVAVGLDVEIYKNFFVACFKRFDKTGKAIAFELSERCKLDMIRLRSILMSECIVTFNGMSFDIPMVAFALRGAGVSELKAMSDHIIGEKVKYWDIEKTFNITLPRVNHIDLKEPNPSVRQGLKTLNGRLHGKRIMNLPYKPDSWLSHEQMNVATLYCMESDLDATKNLFYALKEPLLLRQNLGKRYNLDLRSKSDAQVGEAVVKARIERRTSKRIYKSSEPFYGNFKYTIPPFIKFETPYLKSILTTLADINFFVNGSGRVEKPEALDNLMIHIGNTEYRMGVGGLHSTEESRAVVADADHVLVDVDVAGHYPATIVKLCELGLHPRQAGPAFTAEYKDMLAERNTSKRGAAAAKKEGNKDLELRLKTEADGGKIANNGIFGKLLSLYSFLHHPPLGLGCTITGQLTVLMLIERAEAAGIPAISGNTDGVLFYCPRDKLEILQGMLKHWEEETGFEVEMTKYKAIYNRDVNTYMALKEDGTAKRKGAIANPWADNDLRGQLSKNPQMTICSDAVLEYIKDGTPFDKTIRSCTDVRMFLTIIKVEGGAVWGGTQLGEVVRYYWSTRGDAVRYVVSKKKVAKTDGARPMMELEDTLPADIDYARYVGEATEIAYSLGAMVKQTVFNTR